MAHPTHLTQPQPIKPHHRGPHTQTEALALILTFHDLLELVEQGVIDAPVEHIGAASIDVRLGDKMLVENAHAHKWADLSNNEKPPMRELELINDRFTLYPGDFALAQTIETFNLPDDIACEFKLRSSIARSGINHSLAGFGDPGWHDATLTMELRNVLRHTILQLSPGMRIGQVVFFRGKPVPADRSYAARGRYNGQTVPTESKGHG